MECNRVNEVGEERLQNPSILTGVTWRAGLICKHQVFKEGLLVYGLSSFGPQMEIIREKKAAAIEPTPKKSKSSGHLCLSHRLVNGPLADAPYENRTKDFIPHPREGRKEAANRKTHTCCANFVANYAFAPVKR